MYNKTTTRAFLNALAPLFAVSVIFFFAVQFGAETLGYEMIKEQKLSYWQYEQVFVMFQKQAFLGILILLACAWAFVSGAKRTKHDRKSFRNSIRLAVLATIVAALGLYLPFFGNQVFGFFDSYRGEEMEFFYSLESFITKSSVIANITFIVALILGAIYVIKKADVERADKVKVSVISAVSVILAAIIGTIVVFSYGWNYN